MCSAAGSFTALLREAEVCELVSSKEGCSRSESQLQSGFCSLLCFQACHRPFRSDNKEKIAFLLAKCKLVLTVSVEDRNEF